MYLLSDSSSRLKGTFSYQDHSENSNRRVRLTSSVANSSGKSTSLGILYRYTKDTFGDERRTQVNAGKVGEFNAKDTIPNEEIMVVLSKNNYIKRLKANSFRTQRRGGK